MLYPAAYFLESNGCLYPSDCSSHVLFFSPALQVSVQAFICAASSTSVTEVSKLLSSFYRAIFPRVNDLWVSKRGKADVPCVICWILNDSTGVVEVIKQLDFSRLEVDKTSLLLLWSFDFSTVYTKIDLLDLKACMKVLINKVFHWMLKCHRFRFLWLNKEEILLKISIVLKLQRLQI